jgi:hypothetical protein
MGRWLVVFVVVSVVAATVSSAASSTRRSAAAHMQKLCPVTLTNNVAPPGNGPKALGYRHGGLWVELWPYGVTVVGKYDVAANGRLEVKVPWYRYGRGKLKITATRLDKIAPRARTSVPAGYGPTGFQASSVDFPSQGCWRVTGTAAGSRLSFVTIVLKTKTVREEVPSD